MRASVPSAATSGKGDNQIGPALVQHPKVANESRVAAFIFPVCRKLNQFQSARPRPVASNAIDAAGIALNDCMKAVLGVTSRSRCVRDDEFSGAVKKRFWAWKNSLPLDNASASVQP